MRTWGTARTYPTENTNSTSAASRNIPGVPGPFPSANASGMIATTTAIGAAAASTMKMTCRAFRLPAASLPARGTGSLGPAGRVLRVVLSVPAGSTMAPPCATDEAQ